MPLVHNLLSDSDDEDDYLFTVNLLKPVAKRTTAVPRALKPRASTTPRLGFNRPETSPIHTGALLKPLPSTARFLLRDLHAAMVAFSSETQQGTHSFCLSVSIGLAVERVLQPTLVAYQDTLARSKMLRTGLQDDGGIENLQEILKKFAKLSVMWGYDWKGHSHTRYEERMHANNQVYGCTYPVSDVIFRNIARAAAGQPLIVSDSIIGTSGNKWEGVNVREEPCSFESAGGRGTVRLFNEFAAEVV
eukprot:COSAG02_NODE_883_length_16194_cov_11.902765_2_plen_247_part_00